MPINLSELKEILQSSNINFLIGAGASRPYLPILGSIEDDITAAGEDQTKLAGEYRRYFDHVMLPSRNILNNGDDLSVGPVAGGNSERQNFDKTRLGYATFFSTVNRILLDRKSTLLSKQANVFTTNIDIFMEKALEDANIDYNDGFAGKIAPTFSISNFHKSFYKTSTHFGNISEIPSFNIMKLHGSLSWEEGDSESITYSKLKLLDPIESATNDGEFLERYEKLRIVNPSKGKFQKTVMDETFYELLRIYSSELEKENSVLFVIGFSMADEHIRAITKRVADSNPTLKIYVFCHTKSGGTEAQCREWFQGMKYQNLDVISPEKPGEVYDIGTIATVVLSCALKELVAGERAGESTEAMAASPVAAELTEPTPEAGLTHISE